MQSPSESKRSSLDALLYVIQYFFTYLSRQSEVRPVPQNITERIWEFLSG